MIYCSQSSIVKRSSTPCSRMLKPWGLSHKREIKPALSDSPQCHTRGDVTSPSREERDVQKSVCLRRSEVTLEVVLLMRRPVTAGEWVSVPLQVHWMYSWKKLWSGWRGEALFSWCVSINVFHPMYTTDFPVYISNRLQGFPRKLVSEWRLFSRGRAVTLCSSLKYCNCQKCSLCLG